MIVVSTVVSKSKPLFDQHEGLNRFRVESCMAQRNRIAASQKNPFNSDSRSCVKENEKKRDTIGCELTQNQKNIPCKPREVRELGMVASPPLQWITCIEIFTRELEELLDFVCECLRKVSVLRREID